MTSNNAFFSNTVTACELSGFQISWNFSRFLSNLYGTHENWNDHHSDTKSIVRSGVGTHGVPIIAMTRPEFTMLPDNRREARLQTKWRPCAEMVVRQREVAGTYGTSSELSAVPDVTAIATPLFHRERSLFLETVSLSPSLSAPSPSAVNWSDDVIVWSIYKPRGSPRPSPRPGYRRLFPRRCASSSKWEDLSPVQEKEEPFIFFFHMGQYSFM